MFLTKDFICNVAVCYLQMVLQKTCRWWWRNTCSRWWWRKPSRWWCRRHMHADGGTVRCLHYIGQYVQPLLMGNNINHNVCLNPHCFCYCRNEKITKAQINCTRLEDCISAFYYYSCHSQNYVALKCTCSQVIDFYITCRCTI